MTKLISVVKNGIRKDLTIDEFNEIAKGGPGSGRHAYGTGAQTYFKDRFKSQKDKEDKQKKLDAWARSMGQHLNSSAVAQGNWEYHQQRMKERGTTVGRE